MGRKSRKKQIRNLDTYRKEMMNLANHLLDKASGPSSSGAKQWEEFVEIYTLVENIREKQADVGKEEVARDECVELFMSWLKSNAVKTDHVKVEKYGHKGFGLTAVQDIKGKTDMFKIHRRVMLTTETAKASVLGNVISKDRVLQAMPNILLSVHLLCEKLLPESFWMPYIRMLPRKYTTPLYFDIEELKLMQGSPSLEDALKQYKNIARQYAYFYKLFQSLPDSTKVPFKEYFLFDDYRWAVSTVMTRQNQIPSVDSLQMSTALVPLWDMCNHMNGAITTGFDLASNSLHCVALKDFNIGQELCIFYGARSNGEMLIHDGFIFLDNENDKTSVKLGVSKNDALFAVKTEILARLGLSPSGTFPLSCSARAVPPELLAFLRVFAMSEDELKERMDSDTNLRLLYNPDVIVSVDNETKVWTFLDTRLDLLLKMYKSTIQEDETELEKKDLSEHVRLIIQLKLSEKKILQHAKDYGKIRKDLAPKLPQKLAKIVEEEGEDGEEENIFNTEQQINGAMETNDTTREVSDVKQEKCDDKPLQSNEMEKDRE
ncbi:actin-histidine N-methyltransferase-like isoform X2 [Glandiceps talaboti]